MMPVKLQRERLNDAEVEAHFAWLVTHAREVEIRIKGAKASHSDAATGTLDQVSRQLRAGEIAAVQVRFFEGEDWWCDTVMRAADGYRLVRMRQELPPSP